MLRLLTPFLLRLRSTAGLLPAVLALLLPGFLHAEPQDPPDLGRAPPDPPMPQPRAAALEMIDVGVLFLALSLTTWFVLKTRNRKGVFWLSVFSLGYFGFYRYGCVCAIGSIQNVTSAIFNPAMAASWMVIAFFFLPLLYSALFGRSYCASVCPHGAIQDLVVVRPIEVPPWLDKALGVLPFAYLGLAVFYAGASALDVQPVPNQAGVGERRYIICDYDPFIPIFRLTGSPTHLAMGAAFLIAGMFIGRPYCRYLCPYGVLLRLFSLVAKWNVTIFKDRCIDCALCEHSCPFGAINPTTPKNWSPPHREGKGRLVLALVLLPLLIGGVAWFFKAALTVPLAYGLETPRLASLYEEHNARKAEYAARGEKPPFIDEEIMSLTEHLAPIQPMEAEPIVRRAQEFTSSVVATGAWWLGAWIGLVLGVKFLANTIRRKRHDYEADKGSCYSCARCYDYCPESNGIPVQFETGTVHRPV